MKLIYKLAYRLSVVLLIAMTAWSVIFYFIIIDEINDETDDSLEDYSEYIITRALAGEKLPEKDNGTNNSYHISPITEEVASQNSGIRYSDEMIYIHSKKETEPARILRTIFKDADEQHYELTVAIPTIEKEDLQETILSWIIFLYVLLTLIIIAINIWVIHRSFRPLYVLINWLDNFNVGKEIAPLVNETDVTEFRKLNEATLRNAKRNIEVFEQQKDFIGHASHEMQTPLAICLNRLEILSDDPQLTEKQLGEVLKTRMTLEYLTKLNKTLLLLTKIENEQFSDTQPVCINELARKLANDYQEVYAYQNITFHIHEKEITTLQINDSLASILISNLLKNAFVHNHKNGEVNIIIERNRIIFSNTSESTALDSTNIFKRFYQGTKKEGSTGLGLALVDSIVRFYKYSITYAYNNGKHHFTVTF